MIVIDASALVAIMSEEADGHGLAGRLALASAGQRFISTVSVWEAACAIARRKGLSREVGIAIVEEFIVDAGLVVVAPDIAITKQAVGAAQRYGMGPGYPGILNLGDCFSYATARHLGAALLFKGNDFSRTDIAAA